MSYGFEKLQELGIQRIQEDTHISRQHIESILQERFESIHKVQFLGFISILEREYSLDLSDLKSNALAFYKDQKMNAVDTDGIFIVAAKGKTFTFVYLFIIGIIFFAGVFFTMNYQSDESDIVVQKNIIDVVKKSIHLEEKRALVIQKQEKEPLSPVVTQKKPKKEEHNSTTLKTIVPSLKAPTKKEVHKKRAVEIKPVVIFPKSRLWIGYIDVMAGKKYQKTIKDPLVLDSSKEWLLFLGHGNVNIEVNGILKEYKSKKSLRFAYKDGSIKKVTLDEFKKLNRGSKW